MSTLFWLKSCCVLLPVLVWGPVRPRESLPLCQWTRGQRLETAHNLFNTLLLYFSSPQLLANTPTAYILCSLCTIDLYLKLQSCCRRLLLCTIERPSPWCWQILWTYFESAGDISQEDRVFTKKMCQHIYPSNIWKGINFDARLAISWPSECRRSSTYTLATPTFQKVQSCSSSLLHNVA